jgi:thymidylate synthase (FAD)
VAVDACRTTRPGEWRSQSEVNKQGSGAAISPELGAELSKAESEFHAISKELYANRLECGVAREQARKDLPLSTYTEAYWKVDLHNLLHFLALRMDAHAQYEIREYAQLIGREIVSKWVPYTWEAFLEYRFNGLHLSDSETRVLALLGQGKQAEARQLLHEMHWLEEKQAAIKESREATEFKEKLQKIGIPVPW